MLKGTSVEKGFREDKSVQKIGYVLNVIYPRTKKKSSVAGPRTGHQG